MGELLSPIYIATYVIKQVHSTNLDRDPYKIRILITLMDASHHIYLVLNVCLKYFVHQISA